MRPKIEKSDMEAGSLDTSKHLRTGDEDWNSFFIKMLHWCHQGVSSAITPKFRHLQGGARPRLPSARWAFSIVRRECLHPMPKMVGGAGAAVDAAGGF
jgi:hypothetical protein